MDEKNIDIKLSNGTLTIKGEKKEEKEEREKDYTPTHSRPEKFLVFSGWADLTLG